MSQRIETSPCSCAALLYKENKRNTAIQCALGIIAASGVAISLCAYFSYLPPLAGYCGLGSTATAIIALKIFRSYSSSQLDREIDDCSSFPEIQNIMNKMTMHVTFLGTRKIHIEGYEQLSTLDYLAKKVEKLIASHLKSEEIVTYEMQTGKTFVYEDANERKIGSKVADDIANLFSESEKLINKKNILTRIVYYVPTFFRELICYNDIRSRFGGNFGISGTTIWSGSSRGKSYDAPGNDSMPPRWGAIF